MLEKSLSILGTSLSVPVRTITLAKFNRKTENVQTRFMAKRVDKMYVRFTTNA